MADVRTTGKIDQGTGYGRPPQHYDEELAKVGPGTPCGELMRRYWHPIALSEQATARPKQIKLLGEDLILFRDRKGRPGLLYPRCMHRGTTLFYGKVEDEGIRCCYHGWLFGVDGTCLDQPCEPEHGLHRDVARQPWYPVEERYGLVFAYLGPAEKKPILPRYDILEELEPARKSWRGRWAPRPATPACRWRPIAGSISTTTSSTPIMSMSCTRPSRTCSSRINSSSSRIRSISSKAMSASVIRRCATWATAASWTASRPSSCPASCRVPDTRGDLQHRRSSRIGWIVPMDDENFTTFSAGTIAKGERRCSRPWISTARPGRR